MARGAPTTEVWRALNGATTLQASCGKYVIAVNEDARTASSNDLVSHLGRRGIAARVQRVAVDRGNIQGAILSIAAESGIGLLVMGGFGHSRLQERILGGVTRDMFKSMTVPVLMSH